MKLHELLNDGGVSPNLVIIFPGITILMYAASLKKTKIVGMLRTLGADFNIQDSVGRTALHYACKGGDVPTVEEFFKVSGIDYDLPTRGGETPLMFAVMSGHIEII